MGYSKHLFASKGTCTSDVDDPSNITSNTNWFPKSYVTTRTSPGQGADNGFTSYPDSSLVRPIVRWRLTWFRPRFSGGDLCAETEICYEPTSFTDAPIFFFRDRDAEYAEPTSNLFVWIFQGFVTIVHP